MKKYRAYLQCGSGEGPFVTLSVPARKKPLKRNRWPQSKFKVLVDGYWHRVKCKSDKKKEGKKVDHTVAESYYIIILNQEVKVLIKKIK